MSRELKYLNLGRIKFFEVSNNTWMHNFEYEYSYIESYSYICFYFLKE